MNKNVEKLLASFTNAKLATQTQAEVVTNTEMYKNIEYKSIANSDGCIALGKKDNYLYTAGGDSLSVYNVSTATKPELIGKLIGLGNGRQIAIAEDKLYLTAREYGLWIIDISIPEEPTIVSRFDTVELATGVEVAANLVFVTLRTYGVEIIDCSNAHSPRHLSLTYTPEAQSATYADGLLYVGDWQESCVTVLDVNDPVNPIVLSANPIGGFGDGVIVADGICYAATGLSVRGKSGHEDGGDGHGLDIFKLSGKEPMEHLSRLEFPLLDIMMNDFWTLKISANTVYVADTHNGVFQIDVNEPTKPLCTGHIELPKIKMMDNRPSGRIEIEVSDCAGDVAIGDNVLYIAGQVTGLFVAEITEAEPIIEPIKPLGLNREFNLNSSKELKRFNTYNLGGQLHRLALSYDTIYAACSHAGIKVLKITGDEVNEVRALQVSCAYDVKVIGDKLYCAEGVDGIAVYSIDGTSLTELTRWKDNRTIIQLLHIADNGKFLSCGSRDGILRVFDIANPNKIDFVFDHLHGGLLYGDTFPEHDYGDLMPVMWPYCGIAWYDMSGEKPVMVHDDRINLSSGQHEGITLFNNMFLLNNMAGDFQLLSAKDYGKEPTICSVNSTGCSGVPSVYGDYIAFSHRQRREVLVYKALKLGTMECVNERCITGLYGTPGRVVFHRGRMLIPCGHQGLLIEKIIK